MVRELKKPSKGLNGLEELEKDCDTEVKAVHKQLEKDFKSELDAGFFFSVVFNTKEERDQWLQDHGLKLIEDMFIKAVDFKV
ncbi:hypothetical protein AGMMS49944_12440 [Spirochaetia bacterium]|nr:hypothetical protein AGMMS49944_12440 [Spirochaetia bacterium]